MTTTTLLRTGTIAYDNARDMVVEIVGVRQITREHVEYLCETRDFRKMVCLDADLTPSYY